MNLIEIIAQAGSTVSGTSTSQPAKPDAPPAYLQFVPFIALAIIFYFFMLRPKNKNPKREDMLKQLKKGDEIQTIGGEFGRVVDVRDDRVLLKVDETSNTKIWYSRNSIHRIVTEEKAEAK